MSQRKSPADLAEFDSEMLDESVDTLDDEEEDADGDEDEDGDEDDEEDEESDEDEDEVAARDDDDDVDLSSIPLDELFSKPRRPGRKHDYHDPADVKDREKKFGW